MFQCLGIPLPRFFFTRKPRTDPLAQLFADNYGSMATMFGITVVLVNLRMHLEAPQIEVLLLRLVLSKTC